jgi:pilus assembly protein CpaD
LLVAAYAVAALSLAACASDPKRAMVPARNPGAQYPLKADRASDQVALAVHAAGLSSAQVDALRALAVRHRDSQGGPLRLTAPRGAGDVLLTSRAAAAARHVLEAAGVAPADILAGTYDTLDAQAPLLVSFAYDRAEIADCGRHWSELTHTADNEVAANFGCALTANMAAQIANPSDILRPRPEDAPDAGRRLTVLGKYRDGKVTSADDAGASAAISNVGR